MLGAKEVLTFDEIAQRVTADGRGGRATARQVELELKGNATKYRRVGSNYIHRDNWVRPPSKPVPATPMEDGPGGLLRPDSSVKRARDPEFEKLATAWLTRDPRLWDWQTRALAAWEANGRRGVVTAVTGSGKTNVGIAAIAEFVRGGGQAAVIVPTIELLEQWTSRLAGWGSIPQRAIGKLDGTSKDALLGKDVLVCVVNTAARLLPERARSAFRPVLLIADECHRYGAETFAAALEGPYQATLGLSATPERSGDPGMAENVFPRLGSVVIEYGYEEALDDGVISEFDVSFVALELSHQERIRYEDLTEKISSSLLEAKTNYPELEDSQYLFLDLQRLLEQTHDRRIGELFRLVTGRQQLIQQTPARAKYVQWLAKDGLPGEKGILFHSRIDDCETLALILRSSGINAGVHHSGLTKEERRRVLTQFGRGTIRVLCSPRTLDEGIDVPNADFAVMVAGSTVTRQRVQRLGRVLRKTDDKSAARGYVLYVRNSIEDPKLRSDRFAQELERLNRARWVSWPS
jgi:RNA polymerase primary sigma factor